MASVVCEVIKHMMYKIDIANIYLGIRLHYLLVLAAVLIFGYAFNWVNQLLVYVLAGMCGVVLILCCYLDISRVKNKMMNIIREDAHGSNMMCGGTLINIDENGYKGYSYMQDHTKEAGRAFDAHSKDKDSFYSKKCKKDELNELWERD